jgi:hypothetical protein
MHIQAGSAAAAVPPAQVSPRDRIVLDASAMLSPILLAAQLHSTLVIHMPRQAAAAVALAVAVAAVGVPPRPHRCVGCISHAVTPTAGSSPVNQQTTASRRQHSSSSSTCSSTQGWRQQQQQPQQCAGGGGSSAADPAAAGVPVFCMQCGEYLR